jgi:hypothetical protein
VLVYHAVEFSDGDTFVENDAGVDLRQHGSNQAGYGYATISSEFNEGM